MTQSNIGTTRRRLPSLSALRAFEAAARHGSFRVAAEELNVTHSAISHQVKALEQDLGVPLFARGGRTVQLTEEGQILYPVVRDSFDSMVGATDLLRRRQLTGTLTVQLYVTVAMRWLLPLIPSFTRENPDIRVALSTSYTDWDFDRDHADAGIIFAMKRHSDLDYTKLYHGDLFPVCHPDLLTGDAALKTLSDLGRHRLLDVYTAPDDWPRWLCAAGVDPESIERERASFDSYILALEAACAGDGVTLTNGLFAHADLKSGRLVRPFDVSVRQLAPLCFVCPKERRDEPRIAAFRKWLIERVEKDPVLRADD